ncbi:MAG: argininosuccinate lyase [Chitinivibrionales bacterium]|nr:argininosuccinate lyase [Chitinivibrionales bacterium]
MKMWDGRFIKGCDRLMEEFNNSLSFDKALIEQDIAGSIAWAHALQRIKVLSVKESKAIAAGLGRILKDYRDGKVLFQSSDEDIHMAVERLLTQKIGTAAQKLHTGRSRNDQVVTDFRLYIKKALAGITGRLTALQKVLLRRAEADAGIIIAGYTHLQQAQPILLAHYWLSFFFLLEREKERCSQAIACADMLPLGSGALAGSGFTVDRAKIAAELGFSKISENSIDGVAARDFVSQTLALCSSIGISVSRYAEDLIIWSSKEFSFIELDDAWSTGSSMMPQKKNPDSLELIRGKAGRFIGNYTRFAATLKGVGLTYYKDLQEDKEPLFDSLSQIDLVLAVLTEVIKSLSVNKEAVRNDLDSFLWATDVADYLTRKGLPFRAAHKVVGKIVGHCIAHNVTLDSLSVPTFQTFSDLFAPDVKKLFSWDTAIQRRAVLGGTSPDNVKRQIRAAEKIVKA